MSLALATKGIISDFTGTGSGSGETIIEYVESVFDIEVEMDDIEVNAELISQTLSIDNSGDVEIEIEILQDDDVTLAEELTVEVFVESNEIEIEVNPCQKLE